MEKVKAKDVFISYKAEDFEEASWVKSVLETNGISCWMAPSSIPGGSNYAAEIPRAIRGCKVFVLLLTEKAQSSTWVPKEVDQAVNANKIIMPFMLENCSLKDDFNFYLTNVQRYAAYENKVNAIEKMVREIQAIIGVSPEQRAKENPLPEENQEKTQKSESTIPLPVKNETEKDNEKAEKPKSEVKAPVPTKKPDKKEKKAKVKKEKPAKSESKSKKPLLIALGVIAGIIILSILLSAASYTKIAGVKVKKSAYTIRIENAEINSADIKKLSKMKKLSSVILDGCKIPAIYTESFFAAVKDADAIKLIGCGLSEGDIHLEKLTDGKLGTLVLDSNSISSLSFIEPASDSLRELSLAENNISSIDELSSFSLTTLNLSGNEITSLEPLSEDGRLTSVNVNSNKLTNLNGLESAIKLQEIEASGNSLADINGLKNTTVLETVNLENNSLTDISVLSKSAETLVTVRLAGNKLSDLSALSTCKNLKSLSIDKNPVGNLNALTNRVTLVNLSASGCGLTDISGIYNCTNLRYINLSDNEITSASALGNIKSDGSTSTKAVIDLSNNKLTTLALPKAETEFVSLYGNGELKLSGVDLKDVKTVIIDYSDSANYVNILGNDWSYIYMLGCPLDRQLSLSKELSSADLHYSEESEVKNLIGKYTPSPLA